jgi:L-lactate dehydrogenase (cytochrome)
MRKLINSDDYRRAAEKRLPRIIFDVLEGGALDEVTMRRNREDLVALRLQQRIMRDVSKIDLGITVLGRSLAAPVMITPMGFLTLFHPKSDVAMARAAHQAGTVFVHSAWSNTALEDVVAAAPGAVWAQLNLWPDESLVEKRLEQAAALGIDVLVIAGDVSLFSKRERDIHNGAALPPRPSIRGALNAARKLRWMRNIAFGPRFTLGDVRIGDKAMSLRQMDQFLADYENPSMTWLDVARIRANWPGKLVIKGIMSGDDALAAQDAGVDAVFVSNHGGRQLDAQSSSTRALREVAASVGGGLEILVDSGIRRGSDIVKLHALGAAACLIGRPAVYGLTVAGEAGVRAILRELTEETAVALGYVGATSLADVDRSALFSEDR